MQRPLSAGVLAVSAPRPAAGPTPAFLQFLLGPANAPFSGHLLLGIQQMNSFRAKGVMPSQASSAVVLAPVEDAMNATASHIRSTIMEVWRLRRRG